MTATDIARELLEVAFPGRSLDFEVQYPQGIRSLNNTLLVAVDSRVDQKYGVRIAKREVGEALGIDRNVEEQAWRQAAAAGLSPELLVYQSDSGNALMQWIENAEEWTSENFSNRRDRERIIEAISTLRSITVRPGTTDSMCTRVRHMANWAADRALLTSQAAQTIEDAVTEIERVYANPSEAKKHLVHYDLFANNIIDDGERIWIIDWEFSGPGNGLGDLVAFSMSAELSDEGEAAFVEMMGAPHDQESRNAARRNIHLFEGMWGLNMSELGADGSQSGGEEAFNYAEHGRSQLALAGIDLTRRA